MQWTGKLIGGAIGLALGPIGAALGVAVGHQYDLMSSRQSRPAGEQFFLSTFRLMGHVARADGRVSERKIEAARQVMRGMRLDRFQVQAAIAEFTRGKAPAFDLAVEMRDLRKACQAQPEVMRAFTELQLRFIAGAEEGSGALRQRLVRAAGMLGVTAAQLEQIESNLRGRQAGARVAVDSTARTAAAYAVLECKSSVSNQELTRSYRRLMSRHHPDKLQANGLPESMLEQAKLRTQEIREAYELLRTQRGIS